jgi:protein-S-isoprenylcysteine O-methyltransferase Ste14
MNEVIEYLLIICWGTFFFVWLIGAIYNHFKVPVKRKKGLPTTVFPLILLLSLIVKYIPVSFLVLITYDNIWLKILGSILLVIFTIFTIWSRIVLGKMWSSSAQIKENHKLRTEGPYNITRHPIYTGILGMLLGSTLIYGFGLFLLMFVCIFLIYEVKINNEEKLLIETFGEEYKDFQKRTPQLFFKFNFLKRN